MSEFSFAAEEHLCLIKGADDETLKLEVRLHLCVSKNESENTAEHPQQGLAQQTLLSWLISTWEM